MFSFFEYKMDEEFSENIYRQAYAIPVIISGLND